MKSLNSKVSTLSRAPVSLVSEVTDLQRLLSLMTYMKSIGDDGTGEIAIPGYGKIVVTENFEFSFTPTAEFKKEVIGIRKNGINFLRAELKKLFGIGA